MINIVNDGGNYNLIGQVPVIRIFFSLQFMILSWN